MAISTAEMSADVLAQLAARHLREQLETRIRQELMAELSEIVSQIARDAASAISAEVDSYRDLRTGDVHVRLVFNGQDVEWRAK